MKDVYEQIYSEFGGRRTGGHGPDTWEETLEFFDVIATIGLPCRVLEIGFNNGGSALAMLLAGADVTSVDIYQTEPSEAALRNHFEGRFRFHQVRERVREIGHGEYDLAFIDGDHTHDPVERDIEDCLQLKIPYLLFHDSLHRGHDNIRTSITNRVNNGTFTIVKEYTVGTGKTMVKVNYAN